MSSDPASTTSTASVSDSAASPSSSPSPSDTSSSLSSSSSPSPSTPPYPLPVHTPAELDAISALRTRIIELRSSGFVPNLKDVPVTGCWRDVMLEPWNRNLEEFTLYGNLQKKYPPLPTVSPSLDPTKWSAPLLLRFLKSRKMDVNKAAELFCLRLWWRETYRADELASIRPMPFKREISSIIPHAFHKTDKLGHPIYIQKTGQISVSDFVGHISNDKLMLTHQHFMDEMDEKMEESSRAKGKLVEQCINILDLKGVGLSHRKTVKFFGLTAWLDQNCYPETLYKMYIINSPSFFPVFWNLIKVFLDPVTQSKIKILGKNYSATLIEDIGEENLPEEYGGKCKCEGGCIHDKLPLPEGYYGEWSWEGKMVDDYQGKKGEKNMKQAGNDLNSMEIYGEEVKKVVEDERKKAEWKEGNIAAGKALPIVIEIKEEKKEGKEGGDGDVISEYYVWWEFSVAQKDVNFSISIKEHADTSSSSSSSSSSTALSSFYPSRRFETPSSSSTAPLHRGILQLPTLSSFSVSLQFDNFMSYWSAKSVKYRVGITKVTKNWKDEEKKTAEEAEAQVTQKGE